ncbi:MAG TPA: hypothetical protein VNM68_02985 [Candidatus Polarisedimenticolia bacterium]|nr:hypothetical protein [Candidatus Polarisedimenticolia bacterium]
MAPPPKFEVKRLPSVPHPGPPPIPEQVIIRKFAAAEDVAKKLYETYDCTQTIRLEELSPPGGKFTVTGELYSRPDGTRYWRVTKPPVSNLQTTTYSLEDVRTMVSQPLFFLTTDEIANYDFLYAGQHKLDELNTYVFQVKPKELSRKRVFFQGVIYVDDHDLAIVETYGKFVSEIAGSGTKLPFTMFDTYRENFQDKYWLPTYTSSDDYVNLPDGGELHLRLVLHSTDFRLNTSSPAAPPAASSTSVSPTPANPPAPQK